MQQRPNQQAQQAVRQQATNNGADVASSRVSPPQCASLRRMASRRRSKAWDYWLMQRLSNCEPSQSMPGCNSTGSPTAAASTHTMHLYSSSPASGPHPACEPLWPE